MIKNKVQIFSQFFDDIENNSSEDFMDMIEKELSDEELDLFSLHLEEYYGIQDDDELDALLQIMLTGYLAGKKCYSKD
ncbi:MAG: hypothetical protein KBD63_00400 [Bacteriovoracaceae bacterium]|nr:hypothetical protein [Bacteriovoracaceae bacterium]